jgi:hypothetical protein
MLNFPAMLFDGQVEQRKKDLDWDNALTPLFSLALNQLN